MLWLSGSACGIVVVFLAVAMSHEPVDGSCEPERPMSRIVKATGLNRDLLARFKVPEKSTASDESPLRIEGEIVRAKDRPPFILRAYVLLPNEKGKHTSEDLQEAQEYVKLPFGKKDVVAPLQSKEPFLLFPYEDAKAVRKRLKAGDEILVGIEAVPLAVKDEGKHEKLDIDVKVRRLISW